MTDTWVLSALWVGLALFATLPAIWVSDADGFVGDPRRYGGSLDHRRGICSRGCVQYRIDQRGNQPESQLEADPDILIQWNLRIAATLGAKRA